MGTTRHTRARLVDPSRLADVVGYETIAHEKRGNPVDFSSSESPKKRTGSLKKKKKINKSCVGDSTLVVTGGRPTRYSEVRGEVIRGEKPKRLSIATHLCGLIKQHMWADSVLRGSSGEIYLHKQTVELVLILRVRRRELPGVGGLCVLGLTQLGLS